jgi:hypothetical protein
MSILPSAVFFSLSNKMRTIFDELSYAYTKYSPTEHLSVDENILLLEGRLSSNSIYQRYTNKLG